MESGICVYLAFAWLWEKFLKISSCSHYAHTACVCFSVNLALVCLLRKRKVTGPQNLERQSSTRWIKPFILWKSSHENWCYQPSSKCVWISPLLPVFSSYLHFSLIFFSGFILLTHGFIYPHINACAHLSRYYVLLKPWTGSLSCNGSTPPTEGPWIGCYWAGVPET